MIRDPKSLQQRYLAVSYIHALEEGLLPVYRPKTFFFQDNASIYTSTKTKDFLEQHGI